MNSPANAVAVKVVELTKSYHDLKAVNTLSLEIRKGEVFGLLGPNGAGKTTSINMICGLLKPDKGVVIMNGEIVSKGSPRRIRSRVGVCPQNIIIWPKLTCFEQLVFMARMYDIPADIARQRADNLLKKLELREKRNKLANTLSGGMQRRLNILLALVHDPELVILDEPEAGLDPQSRLLVRDFIINIAREKTVIFTTHNMDEAERVSDRVAIMDRGELLKLDTVENLKKSIGEGDILEMTLKFFDEPGLTGVMQMLHQKGMIAVKTGTKLMIKSKNLIEQIPVIYKIFEKGKMLVSEMNIRENTLEDVFIHLTGRNLRQ